MDSSVSDLGMEWEEGRASRGESRGISYNLVLFDG